MPEFPSNKGLSPEECVNHVLVRVQRLTDKGACLNCAIKVVAFDYGIAPEKLTNLYFDTDPERYDPNWASGRSDAPD